MFTEDERHVLDLYYAELLLRGWKSAFNWFRNSNTEFVLCTKYGRILARFDRSTFALLEIRNFTGEFNEHC